MANFFGKLISNVDTNLHKEINLPMNPLQLEKEKLDIITENMREGAILIDNAGKVVFINSAARVMLNISSAESNSDKILVALKNKFHDVNIDACMAEAEPGKPCHLPEVESDSEVYQIYITRISEEESKKYEANSLIWIEDITEAKMLEKKKSEFVSVVAHQLRTPLSGLKWTLHMLINGDFGELTTEQKVFLMKSYENNERMIALVNDMLAADRVESGRMKYNLIRINLRDLVENVLFEVFPNAQKRSIKIDFAVPADSAFTVLVDPSKIRAVVQNVLENSVKYTSPGGTIRIGIEKIDKDIKVSVKDNGIGIPKTEQTQIFSRFFRASNAVKVETSGTGLGLYMVKKIVEQHGGKCWFESDIGKGTTVFFTLPEAREEDNYKKI